MNRTRQHAGSLQSTDFGRAVVGVAVFVVAVPQSCRQRRGQRGTRGIRRPGGGGGRGGYHVASGLGCSFLGTNTVPIGGRYHRRAVGLFDALLCSSRGGAGIETGRQQRFAAVLPLRPTAVFPRSEEGDKAAGCLV